MLIILWSHLHNVQGMALSGGEQPEIQSEICEKLQQRFPNTSKHYTVQTDTFGSIATAFADGTIVYYVFTCEE